MTASSASSRLLACRHGDVAWREAGRGLPLVLLHGIGSGAGSWAAQFDDLGADFRVLAWDAPGYGDSAPLPMPRPLAADYAVVLAECLGLLGVHELVLVGHSLGAMIAAAWAAEPSAKLHALLLASPARGYGGAAPAVRAQKWQERIDAVERLGPAGLAAERAARLCAPGAPAAAVERVRAQMARITPGGYAQAAHLLAHDQLAPYLHRVQAPVTVMCGEHDSVTPPDACEAVAREAGAPFVRLAGVGHACYVEDPAGFDRALRTALGPIAGGAAR